MIIESNQRLNYGQFKLPFAVLSSEICDKIMEWLDFKEESYNDNRPERNTSFFGLSKRFRYANTQWAWSMFDTWPEYKINIHINSNNDITFSLTVIQ